MRPTVHPIRVSTGDRNRDHVRLDASFEFTAILVHDGPNGPVVAIRETADGRPGGQAHRTGDLENEIQVLEGASTVLDAKQQLQQPVGAFPAMRVYNV